MFVTVGGYVGLYAAGLPGAAVVSFIAAIPGGYLANATWRYVVERSDAYRG